MESFNTLSVQELLEYDATRLQSLFERSSLSSVQYIKCVLNQIKKENLAGLKLQALISIAPEDLLLRTAATLDAERAAGKSRGQFHGIPIIVKVNMYCG
jgi:amidase